ncbi:MAG TPA: DNRLRE domain-containing protein [Candidatus Dormibacteraeota bacterium]|nr:DNRLRE domain-containing protein [Candidatus Dormibacteraeota bacterium]
MTAQSAVAAVSSTTKTLKPDIFSAGAPRVGGRSSGPAAGAPSAGPGKEVVADRSRNSRTFVRGANFETLIYPASINYRDGKGKWQPIDNTLVPSSIGGFAYQNRANSYTAAFPKSLEDGSIRFAGAAGFVDFSLEDARGTLSTTRNSATYANALPHVALVYSANADSLVESLRLDSRKARNSFTFQIRTGPGLTAKQLPSGAIVIVDAAEKVQYAFPQPFMYDSSNTAAGFSNEVRMTLSAKDSEGRDGQTIKVVADAEWLKSKARKFPVVIDPSIGTNLNFYGGYDCFIQNTNPNTNLCSSAAYLGTADQVGYDGSSVSRTLLSFPVQTGYPDDQIVNSNILDAELDLTLASSSSTGAVAVTASPITQAWNDNYTTWNSRDNATAWSAPGATFGPAVDTENIGPAAGSYRFINLTQTIQNWVSSSTTNYGFLLKASNEGAAGLLKFDNQAFDPANSTDPNLPHLRIQWNNFNGLVPWYKYEAHKLSDRMSLAVNVANGNLVVQATDLAINGTGLNLHVNRYYNSLADASGWHIGNGWNVNVGCDIRLDVDDFDGLTFHGPDGYAVLFRRSGATWITPPGLDATLVKNGDGTYTLTWHKNGEQFNFQTGGCLQSMVDQNGNTITMSYNGSVQSITDTQNRLTNFTYASPVNSDYITQISDPVGRTTNYTYNANGDLTTFGDANGKNTQYAYNANDQLSQIIDPNGNTVNFSYGTTYPYQLTQIGYLNSSCAGGSCNTTFAYSSVPGACDASVNGDAVTVNTVVTDANGHQTTHCLDNQGHAIQVIDAKGQKQATSYSSNNNVLTFSDAANPRDPTAFAYDPTTNNLTSATEPTGANQIWGYQKQSGDPAYYPDTYADSQGNAYTYGYTSSNLTTVKNNSNGATWTATDNPNGTVASNKDANGNVTSYTYDSVGNLTQSTYPAPLGAVTMTYDGLSRMVTRRDGKGQLTTYGYDTLDRVTQITYSDNSTIVSTYDNDGNTTQLQDNTGLSTFTYDTMNRPTRKVLPGATTMTYTYDGGGNLTSLQDPGGTVTYGYDVVNELISLQEPNGSITTFGYNAGYRRTSTTYPNGVGEAMTYDTSERLTQIKATKGASTLNSFTYSYLSPVTTKDSDLRWSVTDVNNNRTNYNYDVLNRLTSASGPTSYTYGYDANGNLTNDNGVTQTFNAANELTMSGTTTYNFDANGNETGNSAGLSLSYNPKNQTTGINGLSMTYTGATQTERVTAGGTNFTYNVLGCGGASTGVASDTAYTRDNQGQLTEERLPNGSSYTPYYYLFDGLGSVVGLTDSSGNVANTYSYEPYGKFASSTGSVANPWLFAGGYLDSQTGLYKFGMRYYDPAVARWAQQDPQAGPSLYAYVNDNPVNSVDPSGAGIFGDCLKFGLGAAIGGAVGGVITGEVVAIFTTGGLLSVPFVIGAGVGGFLGGFAAGCLGAVFANVADRWGWFKF